MADFSGFTFKPETQEAEPEKKDAQGGPDFSGFSFKDVTPAEAQVAEVPEPSVQTTPMPQQEGFNPVNAGRTFPPAPTPTVGDLDVDSEGVLGYLKRRGGDIFESSLVSSLASVQSEAGRVLQQKGTMEDVIAGSGEDAGYFDKIKAGLALANPLNTLITVMTGDPLGFAETGAKTEQQGTDVRAEAQKDLQIYGEEADTTGKQIAFDVVNSAGATAPAIATAPLALPSLTLSAMGATAYFDTTQEAYEKTQSVRRARVAGFVDGFVEAGTEMIPIRTLFNLGKGKSLLKDAIKFLAQEEGSELAATALQDLNAKLLYEPDMTLSQAMENLGRTAMSTPFSAGLQAGAMRSVQKLDEVVQGKLDKRRDMKRPVQFTPLSDEVLQSANLSEEKRKEVEGMQAELSGIMAEIQQEAANTTSSESVTESASTFGFSRGSFTSPIRLNDAETVYEEIRVNGLKPLRQGKVIEPEAIQPGEVVTVETPRFYDTAMRTYKMMQESAEYEKSHSKSGTISKETQRSLDLAKEAVQKARTLDRQYASKLGRARDLIDTWVKKYAPDMKVMVAPSYTPKVNGAAMSNAEGVPFVIYLGIETANANARDEAKKGKAVPNLVAPGNGFNETIAHEFGHALIGHVFKAQPVEVREAIQNDWLRFLEAYRTSSLGELGPDLQPSHANSLRSAPGLPMADVMENNPKMFRDYIPSFTEFLAHRMARKEGNSETTQKFFPNARKTVEKYWKGLPKSQRFDKSFELFLDKLAKETQLNRAQAEYEGRVRRYRAALAAMRAMDAQPYTTVFSTGGGAIVPPTNGAHWGGRDGRSKRINASIDKFNKMIGLTAGLTHLSELNKHIPGVGAYLTSAKAMWQDKMRWTSRAADVLREWATGDLVSSTAEREQLSKFLFEADRRSEVQGRMLDQDEMAELREEFGISNSMYQMAEQIWNTFSEALQEVEDAVLADLQAQLLEGNTVEVTQAIRDVQRDFAAMRNRNYMPHSRFGTYTVTGYAQETMTLDDREYKRGQIIHFSSFASESEALQGRKDLEKEYGSGVRFGVGIISDSVRELIDLPPALARLLENKLNLDPTQQKELTELRAILAPGQSFRKRFVQRDSIAGYSDDAIRVFADYMQKFAGHLSRIKHVPKLQESIQLMKDSAMGIRQQGGNSVKREKIINWYEKHLDYYLDPGNELASLRAIGFLWYLGFNVKSAVVNATQVPMVTYPYLAQEFNDISASAAISSAMYQVTKAQFTEKGMDPDAARMVEELAERGIIDESLATELAALAEGGFLARAPGKIGSKLGLEKPENVLKVQKFFEYGALMFQAMEKMNRRITAVAAYQLSRKSGRTHEEAVDFAHKAVEQTQYEYARFNRPEMMRGKLGSNVFMFWQYITNTLWFLGQNKQAAARYMAIMFLMGGLEGIPGMGNLLDLLDFGIKKLKEATGWSDPKKGAREYLWEYTSKLDDDPFLGDVINSHTLMNGYSSRMMGMYDLSASVQMGQILPLTQYLATDMDPRSEVTGGMADLAGAVVNIPIAVGQAVFSDEPDLWKRYERGMPSAAKGLSQAIRFGVRGEEDDRRGAQVAEFNWPNDVRSWAELTGRAAGFQLTRITEEKDRRFASFDAIQYYAKRHTSLTQMMNYAQDKGDEDKIEEAYVRINRFNGQVPYPEMMIQLPSLVQSIKQAQKKRTMREIGIAEQQKYIRLQQGVESRRTGGEE